MHWHRFKLVISYMLVCASHERVILDESISYGTVGQTGHGLMELYSEHA